MEKRKITQKEWNKLHKHWKIIVDCVFRAEGSLDEGFKKKLLQAKGKSQDEIIKAADEYNGAVAEEILKCTFEVK